MIPPLSANAASDWSETGPAWKLIGGGVCQSVLLAQRLGGFYGGTAAAEARLRVRE